MKVSALPVSAASASARSGFPARMLGSLAHLALAMLVAVSTPSAANPARWSQLATPLLEHLTPEQGLPHQVAMALAQDSDGYLWIGTQNGLARWDGYRMQNYHHIAGDASSLPGDFIQSLHVDRRGRLWVGTVAAGLAMYDKRGDRFVRLHTDFNSGPINAIAGDARGGLWVGTPTGLHYHDPASGTVQHFSRDPAQPAGLPDNQIRALLLDHAGNLWIGSGTGLSRRPAAGGAIAAVAVSAAAPVPASPAAWQDSVIALAENSRGEIAFGTLKSGVGTVTADGGARILALSGVRDMQANMVLALAESVAGNWWASTYGGGIVEFNANSGAASRILHQPAVSFSLSNDRAAALLRDRSGLVWVTTERGVDIYDPRNDGIDSVFGAQGMQEAAVSALMSDSRGQVWLALADQGIDLVAPDGSRSAALRPDPTHPDSALPNRVVLSLAEAAPGEAWIGTQLGLYRSRSNGNGNGNGQRHTVSRVALPLANPYPRVGTILPRDGQLWLGTYEGLLRYDPRSGKLQHYGQGLPGSGGLSDNRIHAVIPDSDGALWVGTRNGLNRLDPVSGAVEQISADATRPTALSDALISSLAIDGRGRLWVGTFGNGICVMTGRDASGAPVFQRLGMADGLPTAVITALQVDRAGRVWATTSDGIAAIDPGTLKARALGRADGLAFRTFFVGAATTTPDQDVLFGATAGLAVIYPSLMNDWGYRPPLVISALRVDQRRAGADVLDAAIAGSLTLTPAQRSFEVELAALDFSAPRRNRYAYMLEGFDQHWIEADSSRRTAAYSNLSPGRYRLRMRGSNREGLWNADELSLQVVVLPAWHQTWWAWLGYLLAACAVSWGVYRWRVRQLRRTGALLQAQVYSRTQHLEKLNAIVKSINEQLDFDALLHTILHESTVIRGIDSALALVREAGSDTLGLRAAWGRIAAGAEPYLLPLAEAEARYAPARAMIAPDIFVVHHEQALPGQVCAQLSVRIVIDGMVEGYLVFENYQYQSAFSSGDLDLLKALKEPFVSAYQKARALRMIEQARANAEAATRAKSEFLANISHEIRTPMNAILGFAGLGTHLDLPPQPLDYFRKIGRAGQSLLEIINDVLDFSKIESGKLELEALPFDLPDTLNQIADLFAWRAAERGLELVIWAAPEVPATLLGDSLRLSQILVNLVGNALKFTARGHIELRVELDIGAMLAADADAGAPQLLALRFTVEDTGLGISAEQQARLFQAFAQADASTTRLYGGTGLGLAISQQLVRKMGGVIRVDSEPGIGSSFSFSVRLQGAAEQAPRLLPVPPGAAGKRVLLVDDNAAARHMLAIQLRGLGLDPRAVGSGAAAVAALQQQAYDVLLIDADMPELDGIDTLRLIASHADLAAVPAILMVTAYAREHNQRIADAARGMAFLDKPSNPYLLRSAVLGALGMEAAPAAVLLAAPSSLAVQRIRGAQVLVVDDNSINQQVASEILQRAGVKADLAGSGEQAARMVDAVDYAAVLMDIQMPDMDGYQATALIRASERHAALPIIAMTAHAVAGYRERCLAMDMNDYVTKPIDPDTLYAVLATWIGGDGERAVAAVPAALPSPAPAPAPQQAAPEQAETLPALPGRQTTLQPGIDMVEAMARLGGHGALLSRLLQLFADDFGPTLQQIHDAIDSGDLTHAANLVHKIKGAAANLSATDLYIAATALEDRLRAQQSAGSELLRDFALAFDIVMDGARALPPLDAARGAELVQTP